MKRLLALLLLAASPLAAQPSKYSLETQVKPGFAATALGDTYYAITVNQFARVAPNTTATRKFWRQVSSGAPAWDTLLAADVPTLNQDTTGKAGKADALSTTGASVNVAASAAPSGSGKTLITTDATHATWQTASGSGTVTSVGNGTIGPLFSASWATATTTPALSLDLAAQSANCVVAGPASAGPTIPTCRALVSADIPTTLAALTVTAAPTFSALTSGYLPAAGAAGLMGNSPIYTDGTNISIGTPTPGALVDLNGNSNSLIAVQFLNTNTGASARARWFLKVGTASTWLDTVSDAYVSTGYLQAQGAAVGGNAPGGVSIANINAAGILRFYTAGGLAANEKMRIDTAGNVGIGTAVFGTSAAAVLGIGNGTAPSTSPADMIQLWAEDVTASSELRVRDEAGNVTTLSPHNFSMFTPAATQAFPWSYYSKNAHIGKEINVDMYGAIAALETLTGKQFIYVNDLPADQIEDWTAQEAAKKITVEKQRLDKATAVEVEVAAQDAIEVVAITQERPSATLTESVTKYHLNAANGKVETVVETRPKTETFDTGETESRLKAGVRLDEATGRFWRKTTAQEAVVEPYVPKAPPAWMKDRMKVAN
jgi:hypothetical protein